MDQDDGPNFGYAYGDVDAGTAPSWNPALRPDHEEDPWGTAAPIIEFSEPPKALAADPSSATELSSDKVEAIPNAPETATASDTIKPVKSDNSLTRSGHHLLTSEAITQGLTGHLGEALRTGFQEPVLDEPARGTTNGVVLDKGLVEDAGQPDQSPAVNYEHQGDATLLEEAVTESATAPLVEDSDPMSDAWGTSGDIFDIGAKSSGAPLPTPHAEASGTNVGDQIIGNTTVGGNTGEEKETGIDWGTADDQDFFGDAGSGHMVDTDFTNTQAAPESDSMWDLELDDEFLPDADGTPAPFDLDDEGFLDDEPSEAMQPIVASARSVSSSANRYAPQGVQGTQTSQAGTGPFPVSTPQFADLPNSTHSRPIGASSHGPYGQPSPFSQPSSRPALPSTAQSFADKAKGGYSSPYDLPEDVVTTRRRPAPRPSVTSVQSTPPPPRSSSMLSSGMLVTRPAPPSAMSASSLSPPSSSQSNAPTTGMGGMTLSKPTPSSGPPSEFFAELPVTTKPRPAGRYTPQQNVSQPTPPHHAPPQLLQKERTSSWSSLRNEVLPDGDIQAPQLRQPERLPVFPDEPSVPVRSNSLPVPQPMPPPASARYSPAPPPPVPTTSRYSPAPPTLPAANARYSPAPPQVSAHNRYGSEPPAGVSRPASQSFAPRTSSPLTSHTTSQDRQETAVLHEQHVQQIPGHQTTQSADALPRAPFRSPLEGVREAEEPVVTQTTGRPPTARSETPPPRSSPSSNVGSPKKRPIYTPHQHQTASHVNMASPVRSRSGSPEALMKQQHYHQVSNDRSVPMYGIAASTLDAVGQGMQRAVNVIPHKTPASHEFEYIAPIDERAADPLERWKGYPIFRWGLGGTVITSFPKQIPRYGGGGSMPMMKCSPGEVKVQNIKEIFPLTEHVLKFPGPLKSKSKKKDVSTWLGRKIESLQIELANPGIEQSTSPDDLKRLDERILLWRILQTLVDNDGHLEGNAVAEAAVRKVFSPEAADALSDQEASFATAADLVGHSRSNTLAQAEPLDPKAIEELRTLLTTGDRLKAVWHAVDQRLWGHAMLLSSTLSKDVWKQVVQEFVRKEVKKTGRDNQALAALYEVFAGNWEDCIDELVPASARAGFQMVSTDGAGSTQNALQGLDKWKETLCLILNNRSDGDSAALLSLGKLLSGYGRVEAAHVCFIFARSLTYFGGVDDTQTDIVLIGADHHSRPLDLGNDIEPILLTEVYEFALSLAATGGSHIVPHLQNYKLAHAYQLAEHGHRTDAQSYCDAIATAMKSTTRISPYYNASFIASLDDLSKRLSQSPKDGSTSWISKPSMDKVSSSFLSKFNSFIAGDEDDASAANAVSADVGPFAKIAGSTPTISPSQSNIDLYGAYSGYSGATGAPSAAGSSRYAPSNAYAPRSSSDQMRPPYETQGRPSMDSQSSNTYMPSPSFSSPYTPSQAQFSPSSHRNEASKTHTYAPLKSPSAAGPYGSSYQPTPPAEEPAPSFGEYHPPQATFDTQPPSPPAEAPHTTDGYAPPTSSYDPPSYQPYTSNEEDRSPVEERPKKKSFLDDDDDDDLAAQAAKLKIKPTSEADRKADEAFRKAAEADAQREKESLAGKKGGWFGGWFKKDAAAGPGPIKAKLGEENSFYYDPELKKWVNKKAGATEPSKPIATPPPPKSGPPSRSVSGNTIAAHHALGGTPSSLPHAMSAPPSRPPTSNPQRSSSMPPPISGVPSRASTPGIPSDTEGKPPTLMPPSLPVSSGPPSRPSTGLSNASSIDDLLGAATAKKGGAKSKKRGGRYIDVMAQK